MLIRLAILVVAITAQVSHGHSRGNADQDGKNGHQPPASSVAICDPKKPAKEQPAACQVSSENTEQHVKLTEVPPLSIVKSPKDWLDHVFDWGPWVFNFLLVIVGAVGGVFAWRTLRAINTQARLMREQSDLIIAKERARISVSFPPGFEIMGIRTDQKISLGSFRIVLNNIGGTSAFNVEVGYYAYACDKGVQPASPIFYGVVAPTTIQSGVPEETHPLTIEPRFSKGVPSQFDVVVAITVVYNDLFHDLRNADFFKFTREFIGMGSGQAMSDEAWRAVTWEGFDTPQSKPSENQQEDE